jgi:hypothetical protein
MKFLVDEEPLYASDCPFYVEQVLRASKCLCTLGNHKCDYFDKNRDNFEDCPYLRVVLT